MEEGLILGKDYGNKENNEFTKEEKEMNKNMENIMVLTEEDIIAMSNTEKRQDFIRNYKTWGVWLDIEQLGVKVYKAILPNGSIIYITEFPARGGYAGGYIPKTYRYTGSNGKYESYPDSEAIIVQRLKDEKVRILQERRKKNA